MLAYIVRRLMVSIVVLFFATVFVFVLVASRATRSPSSGPTHTSPVRSSSPGSTCSTSTTRFGSATGSGSPHAIRGDLGTTIAGQDVEPQLVSHLLVTLRMVILATLIAIVIAIGVGVCAAVRQDKVADHAATITNFLFLAAPVFVLGLALKEFVAIPINQHVSETIFYTNGEQSPTLTGSFLSGCPTTPPTPRCPSSPSSWCPTRRGPSTNGRPSSRPSTATTCAWPGPKA